MTSSSSPLRVRTRRWSHAVTGAGRVTARALGTQRTVSHDPATSGGMSGDGDHLRAVYALLGALELVPTSPIELVSVNGSRRVYSLTTEQGIR